MQNAVGFLDLSAGVSDSHVCAIAFKNANNQAVLAAILEKKGGNTENVVKEFTELLQRYGVQRCGRIDTPKAGRGMPSRAMTSSCAIRH